MSGWSLVAYGSPAPQGSKRHVGGGRMIEQSKKVAPWRDDVKAAGLKLREEGAPCLDGPIAARVVFTLARPKSATKARRHPDRTPDLDKLLRSTLDALTQVGLIADDARIVDLFRLAKVWTGYDEEALPMPGVIILAKALEPDEWMPLDDEYGALVAAKERRRFDPNRIPSPLSGGPS